MDRKSSALSATTGAMGMEESATDELLDRAVASMVSTADELDADSRTTSQGVRTPEDALALLERLEHVLQSVGGHSAADRLAEVRSAHADLMAGQLARQRSMLPVLNRALDALRTAGNVHELTAAIPYHVVQLGYDRALFSWVDKELWVPHSAHVSGNGDQAQALLEAGAPYVHVRELLEVEVVRARRPILVENAEGNPRVHPRLQEINHSRSYVAAPVVARGRVTAFVHLDRNLDSGTTDEFDRDLLAAFCQGVGLMLDHLFAQGAYGDESLSSNSTSWAAALTQREREVLQLVAAGLTNAEIAARLYLGEETVKTHVRKLMRKLGVTSRSQASALFVQLREREVLARREAGLHP